MSSDNVELIISIGWKLGIILTALAVCLFGYTQAPNKRTYLFVVVIAIIISVVIVSGKLYFDEKSDKNWNLFKTENKCELKEINEGFFFNEYTWECKDGLTVKNRERG